MSVNRRRYRDAGIDDEGGVDWALIAIVVLSALLLVSVLVNTGGIRVVECTDVTHGY